MQVGSAADRRHAVQAVDHALLQEEVKGLISEWVVMEAQPSEEWPGFLMHWALEKHDSTKKKRRQQNKMQEIVWDHCGVPLPRGKFFFRTD